MNKESFLKSLPEDIKIEGAKLIDSINMAYEGKVLSSTSFHIPHLWKRLESMGLPINSGFFGFPLGERRVFISNLDTKEAFLDLVSIKNLYIAKSLGHRDYMGAVLNLGIARDKFSDFIVEEDKVYFLTFKNISPFIMENLEKVGNNGVTVAIEDLGEVQRLKTKLKDMKITIASMRIDTIVSEITGQSRSKGEILIKEGRVLVNGLIVKEKNQEVHVDDIITIRSHGKYIILEDREVTRKGKLRISICKYMD